MFVKFLTEGLAFEVHTATNHIYHALSRVVSHPYSNLKGVGVGAAFQKYN